MNVMERLNKAVMEKGPLLAGLDPDLDKILKLNDFTGHISKDDYESEKDFLEDVMLDFCQRYIWSVKDEVAAIKINIAFFESNKMEELFWIAVEDAKEAGLIVIADVKRADIGNTSKQYAEAYLYEGSPIDFITVNPYFGTDGVKPFLDIAMKNDKGLFVLVKTSNASSSEIQDLKLENGKKVYEQVAEYVKEWGEYTKKSDDETYNIVGAVVGATHPEEAELLRKLMPNTFFLVPGYGAQGATAEDIVVNFDNNCGGAIVNSSRGIMFAYEKEPYTSVVCPIDWTRACSMSAKESNQELKKAVSETK